MSTIVFKMQQHAMTELGDCIEQGLRHFGRAMSIYEDMKHSSEMGERNMNYRYPMPERNRMSMRERDYEEYDDNMGERRDSRGRYSR